MQRCRSRLQGSSAWNILYHYHAQVISCRPGPKTAALNFKEVERASFAVAAKKALGIPAFWPAKRLGPRDVAIQGDDHRCSCVGGGACFLEDQEHGVFMHKMVLLRLTMLPDGWCRRGLAALTFELCIMFAALSCFLDAMASVADGLSLLVVLVT